MHPHSSLREREPDPACPDPELERASAPGELDEEVDDRVDGPRVEHHFGGLVVPRGDALVEVAVVVHSRNVPPARRESAGPARDEDVLTAVVADGLLVEAAEESFELEPGDIEESEPLVLR